MKNTLCYDPENLQKALDLYEHIGGLLIENNLRISFMESCTGGLLTALLTNTEGISDAFREGFITYCNEAKVKNSVDAGIIKRFGVYSAETARAMAAAARKKTGSDIGVGITGCFGRVDPENPLGIPGEVFFAVSFKNKVQNGTIQLPPLQNRFADRILAALAVGQLLLAMTECYCPGSAG